VASGLEGRPAAQPAAAPDRALKCLIEVHVAFVAFRFTFGLTAQAARRVSPHPLGVLTVVREEGRRL